MTEILFSFFNLYLYSKKKNLQTIRTRNSFDMGYHKRHPRLLVFFGDLFLSKQLFYEIYTSIVHICVSFKMKSSGFRTREGSIITESARI